MAILLQDDNHWVRSKSFSFKIIITQAKKIGDPVAEALALKKKKGGKVKLKLRKEKLRPDGELIIKIKGGSCPAGLIAQVNNQTLNITISTRNYEPVPFYVKEILAQSRLLL